VHLFAVGLGLTALGFAIAWRMDSTQGFHAVMSVFLLPMWLLSGAFFPPGDNWIGWIIRANPLTYAVAGLRRLLYWEAPDEVRAAALPDSLPGDWTCAAVTILFVVAMFWLAWRSSARRTSGDLL
jgi:ABC-2 type transport system permease protein